MIGSKHGGSRRAALVGIVATVAVVALAGAAAAEPATSTTSTTDSSTSTSTSTTAAPTTTTTAPPNPSTTSTTTAAPSTTARAAATPNAAYVALTISRNPFNVGNQRVGTWYKKQSVIITNATNKAVKLKKISFGPGDQTDFAVGTNCFPNGHPRTLQPKVSCAISVLFTPRRFGARKVKVYILSSVSPLPQVLSVKGTGTGGYFISRPKGGVSGFGDATVKGKINKKPLSEPVINIATTHTAQGYWLLGADGGVFTFGRREVLRLDRRHAPQPTRGRHGPDEDRQGLLARRDRRWHLQLRRREVLRLDRRDAPQLRRSWAWRPRTSGKGYWLVAADGGIFSFGDAKFYGSTGGMHLNKPIVAMSRTPSGNGYWLVAADGGVFCFGGARFKGSAGNKFPGLVVRAWRPEPTVAATGCSIRSARSGRSATCRTTATGTCRAAARAPALRRPRRSSDP